MPKMHYFSNKYSKIAKHWGLSGGESVLLNLRFWWLEIARFCQIVFF